MSETAPPILILDEDADAIAAALVEAGLPVDRLRPVTGAPGPEHRHTRIALAAPDRMVAHARALPELEWVQSTWAGIRPLLPLMAERPELLVTGVKGVFGPLMAEYLFGWLAALERGLLDYPALQARRRWQPLPQRRMAGRRMTLIGLGSIGAHLAHVAHSAFDLRVTGVSRSGRPVAGVEQVFPVEQVVEAATGADDPRERGAGHGGYPGADRRPGAGGAGAGCHPGQRRSWQRPRRRGPDRGPAGTSTTGGGAGRVPRGAAAGGRIRSGPRPASTSRRTWRRPPWPATSPGCSWPIWSGGKRGWSPRGGSIPPGGTERSPHRSGAAIAPAEVSPAGPARAWRRC
ncbi:MAG: NAD(P)-dependent oxidoreductase [Gammaproteobacteria bacterium]|nr:NAD(P)-dependent oxidoreductase [Gammaproteobacteria bacterium]